MSTIKNHKKLIPLYILNILRKHTDQDNHIRQKDIIQLLQKYFKISCERKSISRNISYLTDAGFDIRNEKGYYIADRQFNDCEISLIINNILYSKYIPRNHRHSLIKKLSSLASRSFQSNFNYNKIIKSSHCQNQQIFYTIEILNQAIMEKKKVKFHYNSYKCDKKLHPITTEKYTITPYQTTMSNGWPYVISNNNLSFRMDYITNIELIEQKDKENISSNIPQKINIGSQNDETIKFRAKKSIINDIMDQFDNFEITSELNNYCYVKATTDINSMFQWTLKHGTDVKILSPYILKQKIKNTAQNIVNQYKEYDKSTSALILNSLKKLKLYPN